VLPCHGKPKISYRLREASHDAPGKTSSHKAHASRCGLTAADGGHRAGERKARCNCEIRGQHEGLNPHRALRQLVVFPTVRRIVRSKVFS
jgi:hypothetical protein